MRVDVRGGGGFVRADAGIEDTLDDPRDAARAEVLERSVVPERTVFGHHLLTLVFGGEDVQKVLERGRCQKKSVDPARGKVGGDMDGELGRERKNRENTGRGEGGWRGVMAGRGSIRGSHLDMMLLRIAGPGGGRG